MFMHRKIIEAVPFFGQVLMLPRCLLTLHARPFVQAHYTSRRWFLCAGPNRPLSSALLSPSYGLRTMASESTSHGRENAVSMFLPDVHATSISILSV